MESWRRISWGFPCNASNRRPNLDGLHCFPPPLKNWGKNERHNIVEGVRVVKRTHIKETVYVCYETSKVKKKEIKFNKKCKQKEET